MNKAEQKRSNKNKVKLRAWYLERMITGEHKHLEPDWKPFPYSELDEEGEVDANTDISYLAQNIGKIDFNHVDPVFGRRPLEDGIKIGTATWVFMGRKEAVQQGKFLVCPTDKTLVAVARSSLALRHELWTMYRTNDGGALMRDRNAGKKEDIEEIFANPSLYGV